MSYPLSLPGNAPLVTLTHPKSSLWIIELHNGQDSRLTVDLIDGGLRPALDAVEKDWRSEWRARKGDKEKGKGSLIIVGRRDQDKFFSNGLDYERALADPNFFIHTLNPLFARLITFPIPTIAAINGHCFAGGFMLSLACDYRVMTDGSKRNAWLCMNEVHFGAPWPHSFPGIMRAKVGDSRVQRRIALEGHRFSPQEALQAGILDELASGGTTADVLAHAEKLAERVSGFAQAGAWGLIKEDLYHDAVKEALKRPQPSSVELADRVAKARL
ncbi:ClpP/crotonase-like domain-containing protein [Schizophyllum amplum]|uniref:ClpP/crotonase-like domain-containing protein n=1 Tax=Schizophyllum amplum TaxID=97359 RepID=A0A550CJA5_9AGAR|nr:ClpP/crotonase-like domain-containing protein [Auriculariopsis ampla]